MGQRNALAELLFSQPQRPTPNSLAALVGNADADLRAGIGTAQPRDPTWRERAGGLLQDALEKMALDRYSARKIAQTVVGGESSNLPMRMGLLDPTAVGSLFARQEGSSVAPGAPSGLSHAATVWHGSPHRFEKFDSTKIGTGEGAQAYGHGLYLAESRDVAKGYQNTLSSAQNRRFIDGTYRVVDDGGTFAVVKDVAEPVGSTQNYIRQSEQISDGFPSRGHALSWLKKQGVDNLRIGKVEDGAIRQAKSVRDIPEGDTVAAWNGGSLYKVDLPDPVIARMLDWDKPLSQQPKAVQNFFEPFVAPRRAIEAQAPSAKELADWGDLAAPRVYDPKMGDLLFEFGKERKEWAASPAVAQLLRQQGIPGIRYLDGGSRAGGAGTSNFVVFPGEESVLRILERNGVPLK